MLFCTWNFGLFLLIVVGLYYLVPRRRQNLLLLFASYVFYGWWDWRFLGLIALSTGVDFVVAQRLGRTEAEDARKRLVWVSLVVNIGVLGFFKYFDFFTNSVAAGLGAIGFEPHLPLLEVILPVGISFYTFQTMAYTIDVYRRRLKPTNDLTVFALYVCYFPQLVAGPIERADQLLPQLSKPRALARTDFAGGLQLILIGTFRKIAIADFAASEVSAAFAEPGEAPGMMLLRGVLLFALQVYGDFSGYSSIARGTSRLLGIELMRNFEQPYLSTNIAVFWRRWHISLSTWLRDYLYIPLGGGRGGTLRTYRNLALTMLLGGLWHGASWNFVVWGGIHGVALSAHRLWLRGQRPTQRSWRIRSPQVLAETVGAWAATMFVVLVAWVFFRAPDLPSSLSILEGIFTLRGHGSLRLLALPLALGALAMLLDVPQYVTGEHTVLSRLPWPLRGCIYAIMIVTITLMLRDTNVPFIYFQF